MTFNSLAYAAFLPMVVVLHWMLPHRARIWLIVAASYLFYGAWDWRFLALLWISTLADWWVGRRLDRTDDERRRRQLLGVSVCVNLGLLGFFKYFGFFVESAIALGDRAGFSLDPVVLRILLPVGISFYTFQTLSYSIDVYRRRIPACQSLPLFAGYVAFFPQLVAGPIERAERLLPQLAAERTAPRAGQIESALALIILGLLKKVVIADQIAPIVNEVWARPNKIGTAGAIIATLGFALQIYGDFSGYSDIARGSSRLLGIELMHNFREPFLAPDYTELWRRWHISLTSWLRDYLYIPLGGNRGSAGRVRRSVMVTWMVTGLWHGAGWTFVLWGVANGLLLLAHRWWRRHSTGRWASAPTWLRAPIGAAAVTTLFAVTLVPFRAPDLDMARAVLTALVVPTGGLVPAWGAQTLALCLVAAFATDLGVRAVHGRHLGPMRVPEVRGAVAAAAIAAIILCSGATPQPFIYFQF